MNTNTGEDHRRMMSEWVKVVELIAKVGFGTFQHRGEYIFEETVGPGDMEGCCC